MKSTVVDPDAEISVYALGLVNTALRCLLNYKTAETREDGEDGGGEAVEQESKIPFEKVKRSVQVAVNCSKDLNSRDPEFLHKLDLLYFLSAIALDSVFNVEGIYAEIKNTKFPQKKKLEKNLKIKTEDLPLTFALKLLETGAFNDYISSVSPDALLEFKAAFEAYYEFYEKVSFDFILEKYFGKEKDEMALVRREELKQDFSEFSFYHLVKNMFSFEEMIVDSAISFYDGFCTREFIKEELEKSSTLEKEFYETDSLERVSAEHIVRGLSSQVIPTIIRKEETKKYATMVFYLEEKDRRKSVRGEGSLQTAANSERDISEQNVPPVVNNSNVNLAETAANNVDEDEEMVDARNNYTATKRRPKRPWTQYEINLLEEGLREFGPSQWSQILKKFGCKEDGTGFLPNRTPVDLKDKARTEKKRRLKEGTDLGVYAAI